MSVHTVVVTQPDMAVLADLLDGEHRWPSPDREHTRSLARKLAAADVVDADAIPGDVVTLESRVRVRDLDSGEEARLALVTPAMASAAAGAVSVLSAVGAALMASRPGEPIEFPVPGGTRRLRIEQMLYQPEAARVRPVGGR